MNVEVDSAPRQIKPRQISKYVGRAEDVPGSTTCTLHNRIHLIVEEPFRNRSEENCTKTFKN